MADPLGVARSFEALGVIVSFATLEPRGVSEPCRLSKFEPLGVPKPAPLGVARLETLGVSEPLGVAKLESLGVLKPDPTGVASRFLSTCLLLSDSKERGVLDKDVDPFLPINVSRRPSE